MADLLVIHDPVREVAAVILPEQGRAFGPAYIGEDAADMLQAFIDATPFDMSDMGVFDACRAFASFLERVTPAEEVATDATTDGKVVEIRPGSMDAENALAEHEARNASDVPAEQPADTDSEAQADTVTREVRCFNCEGAGMITFGDDSPDQRCGMCGGTGKITQEVPA